jgi:HK97 family phage portal protein
MPGFLSRLFGRTAAVETRGADSMSASFAKAFGISAARSTQHVNPRLAENLATVTACVGAVGSALASCPPLIYRRAETGRVELRDHPVARLVRRPNAHQTWPDLIEWVVTQAMLAGNALCLIEHDNAGRPTALVPIPWGNVSVSLLPSGRLAYDVVQYQAPWGGTGRPRRLLDGEVLHLRDRSDDGLIGRSRISRAPDVLANASALQDWSGAVWRNGATPSGALKHPKNLSDGAVDRLRAQLTERFTGAHNGGQTLVLEEGLEWQSLSINPGDAEVLASRRFTVEELCRLFQVPPPIVQDLSHGTFTNSREAGRWFAQFSLAPWARKIEQEFGRSVFNASSADCSLEIDMSALLRGDAESRWLSHKIAVESGILDPNEVREIEGWNARLVQPPQEATINAA